LKLIETLDKEELKNLKQLGWILESDQLSHKMWNVNLMIRLAKFYHLVCSWGKLIDDK